MIRVVDLLQFRMGKVPAELVLISVDNVLLDHPVNIRSDRRGVPRINGREHFLPQVDDALHVGIGCTVLLLGALVEPLLSFVRESLLDLKSTARLPRSERNFCPSGEIAADIANSFRWVSYFPLVERVTSFKHFEDEER